MKSPILSLLSLLALNTLVAQESPMYFPAALGDKISLYDNRLNSPTMYGLGIEAGTIYFKTDERYRWYVQDNADSGTSDVLQLWDSNLELTTDGTSASNGLRVISTSGNWVRVLPRLSQGNWTGLTRNDDSGIIYSAGSQNTGGFVLAPWNNQYRGLRMDSAGKVGIGTHSPISTLDVAGRITLSGSDGYIKRNSDSDGILLSGGSGWVNTGALIWLKGAQNSADPSEAIFYTGGQHAMRIDANQNVGIGTTNPTHKLAVNGTIRAKEIIVETGWSDYVFEKGYYLAPLSEVEAHIEENGHLPGIPSAAEIEANGAKLSELVTLQMAKIEELTLHLIEKEKQLASANQQLKKQSTDLEDLRRSNTEILERLSALEK